MIAGEGMPRYRNPTQKGNLIIKFEIDFPNKNFLSEAEMKVGIDAFASVLIRNISELRREKRV